MDTSSWITLISATAVVIGWFVTGFLNRRNEIALKRTELRLQALRSFVDFWSAYDLAMPAPFINDPTLSDKLRRSRIEFQLFCSQEDNELMWGLVKAIESRDIKATNEAIRKLLAAVPPGIRKAVGLTPLPYPDAA